LVKNKSGHKKNKKELSPLYAYITQTEKRRQKEYEHFLEHECENLSIPKEVLSGQPFIRMYGTNSMCLVGAYTIEIYRTDCIVLQIKKRKLTVEGEQLSIPYFRTDEIKIVGNILNISFGR